MDDNFLKRLVFSNYAKYRISRHLLFWIVILIYFSAFLRPELHFWELLKSNLKFIPLDIFTTYILLYLILPKILVGGKQALLFVLYFILIIAIHLFIAYLMEVYFIDNFLSISSVPFLTWILMSTRVLGMILISAFLIKMFKYWHFIELSYRELEKKNIENKMALLTSQLHPHFLFNTLNNLYTLSLEKSAKLPGMILGLSDVMRYLTNVQKNKVELNKELEIINSYINIEKLRYHDGLRVEMNVDLSEDEKSIVLIPPLLIFTFIENAFKHGVSKSLESPWIKIKMGIKNKVLRIQVINSIDEYFKQNQIPNGLGLKNVKNRLELYYPNKYKYSVVKTNNNYNVVLELNLER